MSLLPRAPSALEEPKRARNVRAVRVGVISLGCAKNLVDTEVMLGHLDRAGAEFVRDPNEAEVIVINTCGFIELSREESIHSILEAAELKKSGKLRRLVVAGCMVQRYRSELAEQLPEVDAFIGLDELDRVVAGVGLAVEPPLPTGPPMVGWNRSTYLYDHRTPRRLATPAWTAYVKIAEGCDHSCSFCAIPSFRGRFRSRRPESIVQEVETLALGGVREINLIAQDSSHYGRDLGLDDGLAHLLSRLDRVSEIRWIRVHYLYPNTVTRGLIETMADAERIVPYVDLPLQHAHAATLRRMRRGGSAASHLELLQRFRSAMPDVTLRSTFIVGFPGETEPEFEALLEFVDQARFDHLGVFVYSHESSTPAERMEDDLSDDIKQRRRERLLEGQQRIVFERQAAMVGRRVETLIEGAHPETDHLLVGRAASQAPDVDGQIIINDGVAAPGSFVTVELTESAGYDWVGRIVDDGAGR